VIETYLSNGEWQNRRVTFERFFTTPVTASIGPWVALGSPEDYFAPDGAARKYASDSNWMEEFHQLAGRAACFLMEAGNTDNLKWELQYLRQHGLHGKLFLITRPRSEGVRAALYWAELKLFWRVLGFHGSDWSRLASDFASLGCDFGDQDPGPGSVVTFDAEGCAVLLTCGAAASQEFGEPIRAWLLEQKKVGRHVPVPCVTCGRTSFVFPESAERYGLCRECTDRPMAGRCRTLA
jgi:hypothetical protein